MIIEDGTGLSNSDTYADVAFIDAYFLKRNNTSWTGDNAQKEAYIYLAMDYMESVYGQSWVGTTLNDTQALTMPRLLDGETIYPVALQNAVCELALRAIGGDLLSDVGQRVIEKTVGPITKKFSEYSDEQINYANVYNLLKPYISNGNQYSHSVVRS